MSSTLNCPRCDASVAAEELEAHLRTDFRYIPYQCGLCWVRFPTLASAEAHFHFRNTRHPNTTPNIIEHVNARMEDQIQELLDKTMMQQSPSPADTSIEFVTPTSPVVEGDPRPEQMTSPQHLFWAQHSTPKQDAPPPPSLLPPSPQRSTTGSLAFPDGDSSFGDDDRYGRVPCLTCDASVQNRWSARADHASRTHIRRPTFRCLVCSKEIFSWFASPVVIHIQRLHKSIAVPSAAYADLRPALRNILQDSLNRCFPSRPMPVKHESAEAPVEEQVAESPPMQVEPLGQGPSPIRIISPQRPRLTEPSRSEVSCCECNAKVVDKWAVRADHISRYHLRMPTLICLRCGKDTKLWSTSLFFRRHIQALHPDVAEPASIVADHRPGMRKHLSEWMASCFPPALEKKPAKPAPAVIDVESDAEDAPSPQHLSPSQEPKSSRFLRCLKCGVAVRTLPEARRHHALHHHMPKDKPAFSCTLCSKTWRSSNLRDPRAHMSSAHADASPDAFRDHRQEIKGELDQMTQACFDGAGASDAAADESSVDEDRSDPSYAPRRRSSTRAPTTCRLCGTTQDAREGRRHVPTHHMDGQPLLSCRHCSFTSCSLRINMIQTHLRGVHGLTATDENLIDDRRRFEDLINAIRIKCFGETSMDVARRQAESALSSLSAASAEGSEAPEEPHTIQQSRQTSDGGIYCNVCGKSNRNERVKLLRHAISAHFDGATFACRRCSFQGRGWARDEAMESHVKQEHPGEQVQDLAIDLRRQLLGKIKELFHRCFNKNASYLDATDLANSSSEVVTNVISSPQISRSDITETAFSVQVLPPDESSNLSTPS